MRKRFFITGTGTEVGKTLMAIGLLTKAKAKGLSTMALKPLAAGGRLTEDGLRNEDALSLQAAMTESLPYEQINPVVLDQPIAPHIAAEQQGRNITVSQLAGYCRGAFTKNVDFTLVEGAGGWRVPVNRHEQLSALAAELDLPVILVVGMKLGCLNHALLTEEAIRRDGLRIAGWIANRRDPDMAGFEENVDTLKAQLSAPCLGVVPSLKERTPQTVAQYLHIGPLFEEQ